MSSAGNHHEQLPPHYRWNYAMGLVHGITYAFGMAFSEPFSLLPVFLQSFTGSRTFIGFVISIIKAGSSLPQLLIARYLFGKSRGKPVLVWAIWLRWLAWLLLAAITFLFGAHRPILVLVSFILLLSIFSTAGGIASVPFFTMISKAIPPERRGRFMGLRQFLGGLLAIAGGYLVKLILASKLLPFPRNYAVLFFITSVIIGIGYVALTLFREPATEPSQIHQTPEGAFGRTVLHVLRNYSPLRQAILSQVTSSTILISLPFFVLHARQTLGFASSFIGYLIMAQMFGGVLSNFLWARLSDRFGNVTVIRGTAAVAVLAIFLALIGRSAVVIVFVFIFAGFYLSGSSIGFYNYIMEIGTVETRPLLISAFGTLILPVYFYPLIGGLLADTLGYRFVFGLSLVLVATSFLFISRLCEPRKREKACELPFPPEP